MGAPLSSFDPSCPSSLSASEATSSTAATIVAAKIARSHSPRRRWTGLQRLIDPSTSLLLFTLLALSLATSTCHAESVLNFQDLKFTPWNSTEKYISSDSYHARGMAPLYQSVNQVIKIFFDEEPIPPGYFEVINHQIVLGPNLRPDIEYAGLLQKYWGVALVIAVAALIIVLMPIVGLCFCCCRCAGACGGRSQPFDKKHDTCRRVIWGFLLICASTGLLFGVIVSFVTNSYMQEGIENITTTIRHGVDDTGTYLNSTKSQIDFLLTKNYIELTDNVESTLKAATDVLLTDLKNASEAISLDYLNGLVSKLPSISENLEEMKVLTNKLRVDASQLNDGLRGVKRELLQALTNCGAQACIDVLKDYQIGKLDANGIDYNQLPDLSSQIADVQGLLNDNIVHVMENATKSFRSMSENVNKTIQENVGKVRNAMDKAGDNIGEASDLMGENLDLLKKSINDFSKRNIDNADKYINEYAIYRFYFGIAVSTILLLILVCLTFALLCGICGKRPDGYGDDCCNKGSGSRFLMIAVALIFLTISALALVVILHFLVGIILQRGVCVALRDPENDQIFAYANRLIDLNQFYDNINRDKRISKKLSKIRSSTITRINDPFTLSDVVVACQKNESIYRVLHLNNIVEIDDIVNFPDKYNINATLEFLINNIKINNIEITNDAIKQRIQSLGQSQLNRFDVSKFTENLNDNITLFPLDEIAQKLRDTANKITNPEMASIKISIRNQALHLETYQQNLVLPMIDQSRRLLSLASKLDDDLHFNTNATKEPFEESIMNLLDELERAQKFMDTNGTAYVQKVASQMVKQLSGDITKYMHLVVESVRNDIGNCAPMANVYNSIIVAGCNRIVDPYNGFWAGVGWCILLFLPTLVISVKLSSLYQKSDPYPGPLVESEYLYDAYSERDNIPLANGPKNKRRKGKNRRQSSRDRRGDYYEDSGSSHGIPASRDTRYNDMAPKHWDGGPPRYQNPPMAPPASEYERPPPYYYPGASDQD